MKKALRQKANCSFGVAQNVLDFLIQWILPVRISEKPIGFDIAKLFDRQQPIIYASSFATGVSALSDSCCSSRVLRILSKPTTGYSIMKDT